MKSPVYRWKVSHPAYGAVENGPAENTGRDLCREKVGAARWTLRCPQCTFERLEEVAAE